MRVIVCGGRDFAADGGWQWTFVRRSLFAIHEGPQGPIKHLWHGNARGADRAAHQWAKEFQVPVYPCPAEWAKHGKRAGPIRNQNMLGQHPDLVIAFPGGRGTADMVARARRAGVPVHEPKPSYDEDFGPERNPRSPP